MFTSLWTQSLLLAMFHEINVRRTIRIDLQKENNANVLGLAGAVLDEF